MPVNLYCWRCDMVIPMLTEDEWQRMEPALGRAVADVQDHRVRHGVGLTEALRQAHGIGALTLYRELTGFEETNVDAVWHHRASHYGPPCNACGKPLRTPRASLCAACGAHVHPQD